MTNVEHLPNIVIILADNLGYGDLACYGSPRHRTPRIDRLAAEGIRLTDFYSTSGVCTPSRASLMTGCYPRRVGLHVGDNGRAVLVPISHRGLHPDEITLATLLRSKGYATACIGKWHLGDQPPFLPTCHGFDHYVGIPYSEDMTPNDSRQHWPPLPLMRNETVIDAPVDRDYLTKRYTAESIHFIRANHDRPFFLYLPHAMPGSTPEPFASPAFRGTSANGIYGDCVEEMDWSTGQILDTLHDLGLDDDTIVVWTSDNGAVRHDPLQGSNLPLKGWGYDTSEGGQRVPCIVRWPGRIPPGTVSSHLTTMMDCFSTCAAATGAEPPAGRTIDGHDIRPILFGEAGADSPYDRTGFFYYHLGQLQAVRAGRWKLYLPIPDKLVGLGRRTSPAPAELFDLVNDVAEEREVSAEHPDVVARLAARADSARAELGDGDRLGSGQRPAGWVENPTPRLVSRQS